MVNLGSKSFNNEFNTTTCFRYLAVQKCGVPLKNVALGTLCTVLNVNVTPTAFCLETVAMTTSLHAETYPALWLYL